MTFFFATLHLFYHCLRKLLLQVLYLHFGLPKKGAGSDGYLTSLRLSFDNENSGGVVDVLVVSLPGYMYSTDFDRVKQLDIVVLEDFINLSRLVTCGSYGKTSAFGKAGSNVLVATHGSTV